MSHLSYGLDPNQKIIQLLEYWRSTNKGNITTHIEETNSLKESYTGVLTVNQEQIQTISARAMGG
jgi:hypothetical protein